MSASSTAAAVVASTTTPQPSTSTAGTSSGSSYNALPSPSSPQPPTLYMPPSTSSYSHTLEMAAYLTNTFAPAVVPQPEEYLAKESARKYLETLAERISPGAKLLPFG